MLSKLLQRYVQVGGRQSTVRRSLFAGSEDRDMQEADTDQEEDCCCNEEDEGPGLARQEIRSSLKLIDNMTGVGSPEKHRVT